MRGERRWGGQGAGVRVSAGMRWSGDDARLLFSSEMYDAREVVEVARMGGGREEGGEEERWQVGYVLGWWGSWTVRHGQGPSAARHRTSLTVEVLGSRKDATRQ